MKKILLGTSAVVGAALVASTASAQDPIQIGIGGGLKHAATVDWQSGGYTSHGGVTQDAALNFTQDYQLQFTGSTTLENGLTIGVFIELDHGSDDANEDEIYASVSGGFGTFLIGDLDVAADGYRYGSIDGGSGFALDDGTFEVAGNASAIRSPMSMDIQPGNAASIAYVTPTFAGFTGAVSYTPDFSLMDNAVSQGDANLEDIFSFGIGYENSFGAVDIATGGGVTIGAGEAGRQDHVGWQAGAEIGFAGFTIGGGYAFLHSSGADATTSPGNVTVNGAAINGQNNNARVLTVAGVSDRGGIGYAKQSSATLGVSYSIDKVSVGLNGMYGSGEARRGNDATLTTASDTDRVWGLQFDGSYALGPGITWGAAFGMTDHNYGTSAGDAPDFTSYGLGTALSISF